MVKTEEPQKSNNNLNLNIESLDSAELDLPEFNLEKVDSESSNSDLNLELDEFNLNEFNLNEVKLNEKADIKESQTVESSIKPISTENKLVSDNKNEIDTDDIKQVKNIINNNLYQKNIDTNLSESEDLSDDETTIENISFKKKGLDNLDIDTLDSDFELDEEDIGNYSPIDAKDLEVKNTGITTKENLNQNKNTKTIIIEDEKKPLTKFSKPKKKSFKFFD